jgi:excisionase family DNA binding protein
MTLAEREVQRNMEPLVMIDTAATLLNVSEQTVRRMVDARQLPCVRVRGAIRFSVPALLAWIEDQQRVSA